MPALVPVAVAAVCLALLIPAYQDGPGEEKISFHDISKLTVDLSTSRSAEIGDNTATVEVDKISAISLQLDSAKLGWDHTTPIECRFIDPSGQRKIHQVDVETDRLGRYNINLNICLSIPGIWKVVLAQQGADKPFDTFEIEVVAPTPE